MRSSFYGFQIAKSGLQASQLGLEVTSNNVANVNTEDYTRQVLDVTTANYSEGASLFANSSLNLDQGVMVTGITQIRDAILDDEVRDANSEYGTWSTSLSALQDIETVFDETTTDGLYTMLGEFYGSLEDLSNNAGDAEYESVARSTAETVTQVLNEYSSQLTQIRGQLKSDLSITVEQLNTTISELNKVNEQVADQALRGDVSKALLDLRNSYLDTLSGFINISVSENDDSTVSVVSSDGSNVLASNYSVATDGTTGTTSIIRSEAGTDHAYDPENGTIRGYLQVLNGAGSYESSDAYEGLKYFEQALDDFALSFAETLNGVNTAAGGQELFVSSEDGADIMAANIAISQAWSDDESALICAEAGDNDANGNVILMINAMDEERSVSSSFTGTLLGYVNSLMSDIAIDVSYSTDMESMYNSILTAAAGERESLVGVSINEETVNLMTYQKAYEANARVITALDEMLDTLINGTGVVGR